MQKLMLSRKISIATCQRSCMKKRKTINVVRNKFNVSQCSSSTDDRGRRRHSNEFKTTQAVENKMQWLLFSSLYKDMFWREEQEE